MTYLILCLGVFLFTYLVNMLYTSVFYHRGLTHGAIRLRRLTRWWVIRSGNWVTGIDPKAWACMHRLHHEHADTPQDPHSPFIEGMPRILKVQLSSYGKTMRGLLEKKRYFTSKVKDLEFPVNWLNRSGLWFLPHLLHTLMALSVGLIFQWWGCALAYWVAIMSHPLQGWLVNALGHQVGYRNFNTPDHSTNNTLVAFFVMGEGYQNNHHHRPKSANFSVKWWEFDSGYWLCRLAYAFGLIDFPATRQVSPKPRSRRAA